MSSLTSLSASAVAAGVRERQFSVTGLLDAYFARIARANPILNAYIELREPEARAEARAADEAIARGEPGGPLRGVPISIKSSIAVAGMRHEAGSPTRAGIVASQDAVLVQRLKAAGAIILGTTNTPELLMAYETENPIYGRTNHPLDLSRSPGGSSGGEAAAIAAGISAGGIGSDGGGSIRIPAHFSGICGLKPTPGRIPGTGHYPEGMGPFAWLGVSGPMARTVADLELLFLAIAGADLGDTASAPVALRQIDEASLAGMSIGYFEESVECPVTPETRQAVRAAANALSDAGLNIQPFMPEGLEETQRHWWTLFGRTGGELLWPLFEGREEQTSSILEYARKDGPPSKQELLDAWFRRDVLRLALLEQMKDVPVFLCPVCAVPAIRHGERQWNIAGQTVGYIQAMSYTQWFNLLGNPAAVVPVGQSPEGLPIGVQIVGRPWEEELVLAVAKLVERAVGRTMEPV